MVRLMVGNNKKDSPNSGLMVIDYGKICKEPPTKQTKAKHTGENRHPSSSFYITSLHFPETNTSPLKINLFAPE